METLEDIMVPFLVCVVLPVSIVFIIYRASMNRDNKRAEVLIKAIEANNEIDADKIADAMKKTAKSARELLNLRLLRGCIFSFTGLMLVAIGLISWATGTEFSADPVTVPMACGAPLLAIGLSYMIVWCVTRRQLTENDR